MCLLRDVKQSGLEATSSTNPVEYWLSRMSLNSNIRLPEQGIALICAVWS
jgi:hypothetical protein